MISKIFEGLHEAFRDKKNDIIDAQSYRDEQGGMVGGKGGEWDGSQPEHIQMTNSSAIQDIKYDKKRGEAKVTFKNGNGKEYTYPDITPEDIKKIHGAASKGRAFWKYIRPHSTNL